MGTYVSNAQVAARIPYRTFSGTSKPSTTDIDSWIDEAEAALEGSLNAAGIATPITLDKGVKVVRSWVAAAVTGTVRLSFAASGGDPNNEAGQEEIEQFNRRLEDIVNNPLRYTAMLGGATSQDSISHLRSHATDHPDGKTVSAGDFDPSFTRGMDW